MNECPQIPIEPFTPKDPPKNKTQSHLGLVHAILTGDKAWPQTLGEFAIGAFQMLAFELAHKGPHKKLQPQRVTRYEGTEAQAKAWAAIEGSSSEVLTMLSSAEFWETLRATGDAWVSGSDVPAGEVALEFGVGGSLQRWCHATPSIPAASYAASLLALQSRSEPTPDELDRMKATDAMPQLLIALLLGLRGEQNLRPHTCALIDVVAAVASVAVQRIKHRLRVPRPTDPEFGLKLTLNLEVPKYSAFPAGHATVCAAIATVLIKIVEATPEQTALMESLVGEIAEDRERAGLHCSIDNREGLALGRSIGSWMLAAVNVPGVFDTWSALFMKAAQEWDPPKASRAVTARKSVSPPKPRTGRVK